jgi:SAM-dependent methyltransferase
VGGEFPEGWDVRDYLVEVIGGETVNEVGCGPGRLAGKFNPGLYHGWDICPGALEAAREACPGYTFREYELSRGLIPSTWVLFYTVLLHVHDDDILEFLKETTARCKKVLIGEILGREWRRPFGSPPAFNREEGKYIELMADAGFEHARTDTRPYKRYGNGVEVSFLVFSREF